VPRRVGVRGCGGRERHRCGGWQAAAGRDDTASIGADDDLGVDASPVVLGWALGFDWFQAAGLVDFWHRTGVETPVRMRSFSIIFAHFRVSGVLNVKAGIDIDLDGPRSGNYCGPHASFASRRGGWHHRCHHRWLHHGPVGQPSGSSRMHFDALRYRVLIRVEGSAAEWGTVHLPPTGNGW
jgi:hypothetical protein